MRLALALLLVSLSLLGAPPAAAQSYPSRPIRLVIIVPAANAADIIARIATPHMSAALKQNFVIDNRPGAGGILATEIVKSARPDGHTLLLTSSAHAINPTLYGKLPYDAVKDFSFVGLAGSSVNVLVVNPQNPATTVKDFIAAGKARSNPLDFGSSGTGTTVHLAAELLGITAGLKTVHIAYKGATEALSDLMTGRIQFMTASMSSSLQLVRAGKLRALGVTSLKRHPALPDVPAVAESLPGYEAVVWFGMLGPAGIPQAVVETLNRSLNEAFAATDIAAKLSAAGVDPQTSSPEAFAAYVRSEIPKWGQVVRSSGAKVN